MPGAILCYHGLTVPGEHDSAGMHVSPELFERTIIMLRRWRRIVPLREIIQRVGDGKSVSGLIAITFDDAYQSLSLGAREVLVAMRVPATLFVVSDFASNPRPFWWDLLSVLAPRVVGGEWDTIAARLGFTADGSASGAIRTTIDATAVRNWIVRRHKGVLPTDVDSVLREVVGEKGAATAQRSMTWEELDRFRAAGEFDLGVHTRSHAALSELGDAEVAEEISSCWAELQTRAADALPILAFPYGYHNRRTIRIAAEAGMRMCLSTGHRTLPRVRGLAGGPLPRLMLGGSHSALRTSVLVTGVRGLLSSARRESDRSALPPRG
jgi:peptidoglycan/xylan/chitin deacetylase (PgdA/CDA1 family)